MANSGPTTEPNEAQFIEMNKNLERISGRFERQETVNKEQMKSLENTLTKSINNLGKFTAQSVKDVARAVHQEVNLGSRESAQRGGGAAGGLVGVVAMKAIQDSKVAQNTIASLKDKLSKKFSRKKGPYRISDEVYDQGDENLPKAATGGFVKKTGKAIVHAGEKITRKSTVDAHLQTLQMIQSSLQSIQSTQLEMVASLNNVSQSLTDPSAAGGFFKSVGDTAKVLIPLFGGGMYKNDIKKSGNPFATMTDALLEIYRWQRLYGELSKRQLNELIKANGGEQQDVYGKRGVLFEILLKNKTKLMDKLAAHIAKKESQGKKPFMAKAAKGMMGSWLFKAMTQDPEEFEKENREGIISHIDDVISDTAKKPQSLMEQLGQFTIIGQKEHTAPQKIMRAHHGSSYGSESPTNAPSLSDIIGRASQVGINISGIKKLQEARAEAASKQTTEKDPDKVQQFNEAKAREVSKLDSKIARYANAMWKRVFFKEEQLYGVAPGSKVHDAETIAALKNRPGAKTTKVNDWKSIKGKVRSIVTQTGEIIKPHKDDVVEAYKTKKESAVTWLKKIYEENAKSADAQQNISQTSAVIAETSQKAEERAQIQAKEAKKSAVWDKVKDKGKGGVSKIMDFLNKISGVVLGLAPLLIMMAINPKASIAALKWTFSAPMNFMKMMWMYFGKFKKIFEVKNIIGTFKALRKVPQMLSSVFNVVKGIIGIFKSAGSIFKGLGAVGSIAKVGIAKGIGKMGSKMLLKRIPVVGTLMSIFFGIQRFKKGDILGGVGEIVSGAAQLLDLVAPPAGSILSLMIDGLLIMRDINKAKSKEKPVKVSQTPAEAATALGKKSPLMRTLKMIPGIGLIMGISYGIKRFGAGDVLGGIGEIVSGIATTFPGPGTAISMIVDALINFRDIKKVKKLKGEKFNFFTALWNSINDVILGIPKLLFKAARWLMVQWLEGLMKGATLLIKGATWILKSAKDMFVSTGKMIGRAAFWIVDKVGDVFDNVVSGVKNMFTTIVSSIKRMFTKEFWIEVAKSIWTGIKSAPGKVWGGIKRLGSAAKEAVSGTGGYLSKNLGPGFQELKGAASGLVSEVGRDAIGESTISKGTQVGEEMDADDRKAAILEAKAQKIRESAGNPPSGSVSGVMQGGQVVSAGPTVSERGSATNLSEGVKQNAVTAHLNNSAATIRASKQLGGSIARSSEASTNHVNNVINKVTKVSTNNSSNNSGGGGATKLPLWQDLSFLLAGTNI